MQRYEYNQSVFLDMLQIMESNSMAHLTDMRLVLLA